MSDTLPPAGIHFISGQRLQHCDGLPPGPRRLIHEKYPHPPFAISILQGGGSSREMQGEMYTEIRA
jgi:hypothetical protein